MTKELSKQEYDEADADDGRLRFCSADGGVLRFYECDDEETAEYEGIMAMSRAFAARSRLDIEAAAGDGIG